MPAHVPRVETLLKTLSVAVRLFLPQQVADWWEVSLPTAERTLQGLAGEGWLREVRIRARPLPPIEGPLCRWRPGDETPDFGWLSYEACRRMANRPVRVTVAYLASAKTVSHFGLVLRAPPKPHQQTHDVGLSQTYLHLLKNTRV